MGMAASQARYLGLTARKTNVEYEGQQVNQQRVALANQSGNLFNQLMAMTVPVPPSIEDFTKINYSYSDGVNTEEIVEAQPLLNDPNFNYMIKHNHLTKEYTGIEKIDANPQVRVTSQYEPNSANMGLTADSTVVYNQATNTYTITPDTKVGPPTPTSTYRAYDRNNYEERNAFEKMLIADPSLKNIPESNWFYDTVSKTFVTKDQLDAFDPADLTSDPTGYKAPTERPAYLIGNSATESYNPDDKIQANALLQVYKDIKADADKNGLVMPFIVQAYEAVYGSPPGENVVNPDALAQLYTYTKDGQMYFTTQADLNTSMSGSSTTENQSKLFTYMAASIEKKVEKTERAFVEKSADGRFENIKFENSSATYLIHAETVKNDDAYSDSMNAYHYNTMVYNARIEEINNKTKVIQEQDRTLELRLKQLDTEQKALQTEMEAVQKVIQKNVETTFKTFS